MKSLLRSALALLAVALTSHAADEAAFRKPGLQLYSLRAEFTRNVPAALEKVRALGFRNLELAGTYNLSPEKFKAMLDAHGFNPVSAHFPYDRLKNEPEKVAAEAKILGLRYVGCAWIPHKDAFDEEECRAAIAVFNKAGEVLAAHGLTFHYHCHGYEFAPFKDGTFMDLILRETHPKNVRFEMDVFWVVHPGQDPVKWLRNYPGRWELMHLKDMKKGAPTGVLSGKADVNDDVALGTGQMDWPAILRAAQETGVKHYFIEDESAAVLEQLPQTQKYLEGVKY